MTRINVVPPSELCDQHLIAETRELTRIPNAVVRGKFNMVGQPKEYTLGAGHVKFFYDKLGFLRSRYRDLIAECVFRGINFTNVFPYEEVGRLDPSLVRDYVPTTDALAINRARISIRMPKKPRWSKNGADIP